MKLRVKKSKISAATKTICIINNSDAEKIGVSPLERVVIKNPKNKKQTAAVVNTSSTLVSPGYIIIYSKLADILEVHTNDIVQTEPRKMLLSKAAIRKKISNKPLTLADTREIIKDIVKHNLNDLEISSFITALTINNLSDKEAYYMSKAMIESGDRLNLGNLSVDKHSIGGIPGDKTSLILVPIIAASGLVMPKTSSRAITSPAGTADRMEVLAPVVKTNAQIKRIVKKTGACIIWGGAFNLSPADDLFIEIERPLDQDPLLLPSVLGKKKVAGSKHIVIDIGVGPEAKVHTKKHALELARRFKKVGKMLGMKVECVITNGRQPIGHAIGPALEAREALELLMKRKINDYPVKKAIKIASVLLKMGKKVKTIKQGEQLAKKIIKTGAAEKKFREIIKEQGGNPDIMPEKIKPAKLHKNILASRSGKVRRISLNAVRQIARLAGSPINKKAGIILQKKLNDKVKKGEVLYTIYAKHKHKLMDAVHYARKNSGYVIK